MAHLLNLKLKLNDNGSITASWDAITGAVRYVAYMYPYGESYMIYNEENLTVTSYTSKPNLEHNKQYQVTVVAYGEKSSLASDAQKLLLPHGFYDLSPVEIPEHITAEATSTSIKISFDEVANAREYDILFDSVVYTIDDTKKTFYDLEPETEHTYAVRARSVRVTGEYSEMKSIVTPPLIPGMPTVVDKIATESSATINWTKEYGATGYDIVFNGNTYSVSGTTKTFGGLTAGTSYSFKVRAKSASGTSSYSAISTVTTPPKAPARVNATSTRNTVTLNWQKVAGATGYIILFNKKNYNVSYVSTSYTFTGLTADTQYTYQICSKSEDGAGTYSTMKTIKTMQLPLSTPSGISKKATETTVTISWESVSKATGYDLVFNGRTYGMSGTSKTFTGLTAGTSYSFKVRSKDSEQSSAYSSTYTVTTPPKAPIGIISSSTEDTVTLEWEKVFGSTGYGIEFNNKSYSVGGTERTFTGLTEDTVYTYRICSKSVDGTGNYGDAGKIRTLAHLPVSSSSIKGITTEETLTITWDVVDGATEYDVLVNETKHTTSTNSLKLAGLKSNAKYKYKVRAKKGSSTGAYSEEKEVTTTPIAPSKTETEVNENSVNVKWNPVDGATGYILTIYGRKCEVSGTSQKVTGLPSNMFMTYQLASKNEYGTSSYSEAKSVKTAPERPSSMNAYPSKNTATLVWPSVSGATSYNVVLDNSSYVHVAKTNSITLSGLEAGKTYTYKVCSNNDGGSSSYSEEKEFTTIPNPPSTPEDISATATDTTVTVKWSKVNEATSYELVFDGVKHSVTGTSKCITGLNDNTSYTYKVCAKNAGGLSAYTDERIIRTPISVPKTPKNVIATATVNSITVSWDEVSSAQYYSIVFDGEDYVTTDTSKTFSGLIGGTEHTYQVRAENYIGVSEYSTLKTINTVSNIPVIPTNVKATATNTSIKVFWTAVEGARGYYLKVNDVVYGTIDTYKTIYDLEPDTIYTYSVCSSNSGGSSEYSEVATIRTLPNPPAIPTGVTAKATADTITVQWNAVDEADKYMVLLDGVGYLEEGTSKKFSWLFPNTEYTYCVCAVNKGGYGEESDKQSIRTLFAAPKLIEAGTTVNTILISFEPIEGATEYEIMFDGELYTVTGTTKEFTGLEPEKDYTYSVRAKGNGLDGEFSEPKTVTTAKRRNELAVECPNIQYPDGRKQYTHFDPIDALTGAFCWNYTWMKHWGKDNMEFNAMYNSQRTSLASNILGDKWTYSLDYQLVLNGGYTYFLTPYGDVIPFVETSEGKYKIVEGCTSTYMLKKNADETYSVTNSDSMEYIFDEKFVLKQMLSAGIVTHTFTSDADGNVIRMDGRFGARLELIYSDGFITSVVDEMGNTVTFEYDNLRLNSMADSDGKTILFTYDEEDNLLTISDFVGNTYLTNVYDVKGRVIEQNVVGRGKCVVTYDDKNKVNSFVDEAGNVTKYTHDESSKCISVELEEKNVTSLYNSNGQMTEWKDALGNVTKMTYDESGRMNRVTHPDGTIERVTYNDRSLPTSVINRDGTECIYSYDTHNNLTEVQDECGNVSKYTYDEHDNLISYLDKNGNQWAHAYDENNHLKQAVDPEGNVHKYCHDVLGRLVAYTSPMGRTTSYLYNASGDLLHIEDAKGTTIFEYNENGNRTSITDKMGNQQRLEYNAMGQVALVTDFLGNEYHFSYDERGNLITETDPLGYSIKHTYDAKGNQTALTDKNGNITSFSFDAGNQLIEVKDAAGGVVKYTYDTMGNVKNVIDALENQIAYTYDKQGRVISVTNALGNSICYTYDECGNLLSKTDEEGVVTSYTYDKESRLLTIQSEAGTVRFSYDKLGRLTAVEDTNEHIEKYEYNADGERTVLLDKENNKTIFLYDDAGRLAVKTGPDGGKITYDYDKNGNCTGIIDAEGNSYAYEYDANNRLVRVTDSLGNVTLNEYDSVGQLVTVTDARGNATVYEYDGNGNMIKETNPLGGEKLYEYDSLNRVVAVTDEEGHTCRFAYDLVGNLIAYTDANENQWTCTYNAMKQMISVTDANGDALTFDYTKTGKLAKVTDQEGAQTEYCYDALGRLIKMSDADGHSVEYTYDGMDRVLTQTDANGNVTEYSYSPNGNLLSVKDPENNTTTYTYNATGQISTVEDALGNTTQYEYDLLGQVLSVINPMGDKTSFTYTRNGKIATVTDAKDNITMYEYDACGNLTRIIDPLGNVVAYEYDAMNHQIKEYLAESEEQSCLTIYQYDKAGRMIREINPLSVEKNYRYDANGNITNMLDEDGNEIVVRYDLNNKPVQMNYSDDKVTYFRYNKRGELVELRDWNGTVSMERDILGRLTKVTDHNGDTIGYGYDAVGNRTGITYPDGSKVSYTYDKSNRLVSVTDAEGQVMQYQYSAVGDVLASIRPGIAATYEYNANRQPTMIKYQVSGDVCMEERLSYDALGYIIGSKRTGISAEYAGNAAYSYDILGRLVNYKEDQNTETYTYDALGNRTTKIVNDSNQTTYQYDAMNKLVAMSVQGVPYSFGYDNRGNLIEEAKSGRTIRKYVYDATNHMVSGKNLETGESTEYGYNGLHMRVKNTQTLLEDDSLCVKKNTYVIDYLSKANNELVKYEEDLGAKQTIYGHGYERLSQRLVTEPELSANYKNVYFHADHLGSPIFVANKQMGVMHHVEHGAWGDLRVPSGEAISSLYEDSLRFTNYSYDKAIGKHFAQARIYDSALGRMHAKDPVKRGLNPYVYCNNAPVDYVDPTGEIPHVLIAALLGGAIAGTAGFVGSAISQIASGEEFDAKKAWGAAANNAIVGATRSALITSGVGVGALFVSDLVSGSVGSAVEQKIVKGNVDIGESITSGLTNAVGGLAFGNAPLKSVKDAFIRGSRSGAATAAVNELSEALRAGNRGGTGGSNAVMLTPNMPARDPKAACGSPSSFEASLGYQTRDSVGTQSGNGFHLGDTIRDIALGALLGGVSSVAFYGGDKAVSALKDSVKNARLGNQLEIAMGLQNDGSMFRKARDSSYIEPMPKKQLHRIVKAFKKQGGIIQMDAATDDYLVAKNAEAITLNENTILLRQKPGRASVFEELIHATQFRKGLNDGSVISRIQNEIEAQEMLLRNRWAYKLTPAEIKQTQSALTSYITELQKIQGGK